MNIKSASLLIAFFVSGGILHAQTASEIISATGVSTGLCIHVGCGDGSQTKDFQQLDVISQGAGNVSKIRQSGASARLLADLRRDGAQIVTFFNSMGL